MDLKRYDWAKEMEDFVDYCNQFDPTFKQKIIGASDKDIDQIEQLSKLPLPAEYRAFLATMGRTPLDSLGNFFKDIIYGIEAVQEFYHDPPVPVPYDAVYLWTLDYDSEMFLPIGEREDEKRPVWQFGWPVDPDSGKFIPQDRDTYIIADCLLQFLYKESFLKIRGPLLGYKSVLEENVRIQKPDEHYTRQRRQQFQSIAKQLGFKPVPYMDNDLIFYDRTDAALELFSAEIAADKVYVDANDERELARLCEILSDNLDMRRL